MHVMKPAPPKRDAKVSSFISPANISRFQDFKISRCAFRDAKVSSFISPASRKLTASGFALINKLELRIQDSRFKIQDSP